MVPAAGTEKLNALTKTSTKFHWYIYTLSFPWSINEPYETPLLMIFTSESPSAIN